MNISTPLQWEFPDHHSYKPIEIRRMAYHAKAQGLSTLVTTEKDLMNLPQETDLALGDLQLAWLSVEAEVENEAELLRVIRKALR
jgi:tetraacyldisaccharide-1-P 4'-kinase